MTRSCRQAEHLVATGEAIEREFGIPIVNKRISVTPIALVAGAPATRRTTSPSPWPWTRRPRPCGVNFIGGFSALVQKGFTQADRKLIRSIPEALADDGPGLLLRQRRLHQGGHQHGRCGARWASIIKETADRTAGSGRLRLRQARGLLPTPWRITPSWPAPSTAWARPECVINVGVSGPGVVHHALQAA